MISVLFDHKSYETLRIKQFFSLYFDNKKMFGYNIFVVLPGVCIYINDTSIARWKAWKVNIYLHYHNNY